MPESSRIAISAIFCILISAGRVLSQELPTSILLGPGDLFQVAKSQFCKSQTDKFEATLTGPATGVILSPPPILNAWKESKLAPLKSNLGNCSLVINLPPAEDSDFAPRMVVLCNDRDLFLIELGEELEDTKVVMGPLFVTKSLETKHTCTGLSYTTSPRPAIYVICRPAPEQVTHSIQEGLNQIPTSIIKLAVFKVSIDVVSIDFTSTIEWTHASSDKPEDLMIIGETIAGSEEVVVQDKTTTVNFTYLYLYAWGKSQLKIFKEVADKLTEVQLQGALKIGIQEKSILDLTATNKKIFVTATKNQQTSLLVCEAFVDQQGDISCELNRDMFRADSYDLRVSVASSKTNSDFVSVSLVVPGLWREWQYQLSTKILSSKAETKAAGVPVQISTVQSIQLIGNIGYVLGSCEANHTWVAIAYNLTTNNDVRYNAFAKDRQFTTFLVFHRRNSDEKTSLMTIVNSTIEYWPVTFEIPSSATVTIDVNGPSSTTSSDLELKCEGSLSTQSKILKVSAQLSTNSRSLLSIKPVEAYLGQTQVTLQTNNKNVSGNGVTTQLLQSVDHNITMMSGHVNLITPFYSGPNMTNILGIKALGDDVILIHNASTIDFVRCRQAPRTLWYLCNYASKDYSVTSEKFVNAFMIDKLMILVTKFKDSRYPGRDVTKMRGIRLETAEPMVETKVFPITVQKAEFLVEGDTLYTYVLTTGTPDDDRSKLHLMILPLTAKTFPEFQEIKANWGEYFWPTSFSINPHDREELFVLINPVATVTAKVSVFRIRILFNMEVEFFPNSFELDSSFKVSICSMKAPGTFAVIDYTNTRVLHVNLSRTHYHHYQVPLREFGSENIQGHNCDADNGVLQIVGNSQYMTAAKLYTIRLNSSCTDLGNRVHSVVAIGNKYTRVSTIFNDVSDEMVTVLFGSSTSELSLVSLKIYGPHIYLNSSKQRSGGTISLTHAASFPGRTPKNFQSVAPVILLNPVLAPKIILKATGSPKTRVQDDKQINLEDYLDISGPYSGVTSVTGSTFIKSIEERAALLSSNPFADVTQTFDDATSLRTVLLGSWRANSATSRLQIYQENTLQLDERFEGSTVTSIGLVETNSQIVAFALLRRTLQTDLLLVWTRTLQGTEWKKAVQELDQQGYRGGQFRYLHEDSDVFLFTAYKNKASNQIAILPVRVSAGQLTVGPGSKEYFDIKITELEVSVLRGCTKDQFVSYLVVGLINEDFSRLLRIRFDSTSLVATHTNLHHVNIGADWNVHQNTTLRCESYFKTSLSCFKSANNAFSYLTAISGLDKCSGSPTASVVHRARLANVVNLRPIKADVNGDFVSVVVRNDNPTDATEGDQGTTVALFRDNYMLLLYKVSPASTADTVHPYRLFSPSDLGSTTKASLSRLSARFVAGPDDSLRLFVNVGMDNVSVRWHGLNSLRVSFNPTVLNENSTLQFRQLDGVTQVLNLSSVFNLSSNSPNKTEPDDPGKKTDNKSITEGSKGLPVLPTIIIGTLLIIGAVAAGYFLGKNNGSDRIDVELGENGYSNVKGSMIEGNSRDDSFVPEPSNNRL